MRNGTMAPIMDARTHVAALVSSLLAASLLACGSAKAADLGGDCQRWWADLLLIPAALRQLLTQ
jgi:hypothetical protein